MVLSNPPNVDKFSTSIISEPVSPNGVTSPDILNSIHKPIPAWEKPGAWGTIRRSWRTIQRHIWDDPDKPREEKLFLLKLDFFLLTYGCLGYFCKNLDQANINNAYVSGMKEDLKMFGSELTYAGNVFTAGYVISQLPAVILVTSIRPSLLVPILEILWSVSFILFFHLDIISVLPLILAAMTANSNH
jgi:ACS family pantothenate transporter-like MFS transporter